MVTNVSEESIASIFFLVKEVDTLLRNVGNYLQGTTTSQHWKLHSTSYEVADYAVFFHYHVILMLKKYRRTN
jgi:hypothetical protein